MSSSDNGPDHPLVSWTLDRHRIGTPGSVCNTIIWPGQRRLAGRRRHGSALARRFGQHWLCRPDGAQVFGQAAGRARTNTVRAAVSGLPSVG